MLTQTLLDLPLLVRTSGTSGAPSYGPDSIAGLHRWYKADSFSGTDGQTCGTVASNLGRWIEQLGSGDDTTGTSGLPFRTTGDFGGLPWIEFTIGHLGFAPGTLTDLTIIAVHRKTGGTSFIVRDSFGSGDQVRRSIFGDNITLFYDGTGVGQGADAFASPNDIMALSVKRAGSTVSFRENKTSRGSFSYSSANFDVVEIGGAADGGNIDLAELLIYNVAVSDANLDDLYDNYLKPRWTVLP
jgi:hypothetical protein